MTSGGRWAKLKGMETVPLELPADLVRVAKLDTANLSKEAAKLLALELFRENKVSLSRAAELCQAPLAGIHGFRRSARGFSSSLQ